MAPKAIASAELINAQQNKRSRIAANRAAFDDSESLLEKPEGQDRVDVVFRFKCFNVKAHQFKLQSGINYNTQGTKRDSAGMSAVDMVELTKDTCAAVSEGGRGISEGAVKTLLRYVYHVGHLEHLEKLEPLEIMAIVELAGLLVPVDTVMKRLVDDMLMLSQRGNDYYKSVDVGSSSAGIAANGGHSTLKLSMALAACTEVRTGAAWSGIKKEIVSNLKNEIRELLDAELDFDPQILIAAIEKLRQ